MSSIVFRDVARKLPILRSAMHSAPQYHVGSVLENRLGLQVFRTVSRRLARYLRFYRTSEEVSEIVRCLERDGIVVIPDFLDGDVFRAVNEEFETAGANIPLEAYKDERDARLYRRQVRVSDSPESFPVIRSTFQQNQFLNSLVSAVIRRPLANLPDLLLDTYQCIDPDRNDNDIENILHADLHLPTIKMFFYLSDTDETNGAFVYAKGSNRLSFARLLHEYDLSVREAKLDKGIVVEEHLLERRASAVRNIIRPDHLSRMGVVETQICVKANTLVIANNMGFHRRGEFTSTRPRKAILVNYRKAEPALW